MLGLSLRLSMDCTVCDTNLEEEPISSPVGVVLFGLVNAKTLVEQHVCPKCLRHKGARFTKSQEKRIAQWLTEELRIALARKLEEMSHELGPHGPNEGNTP